MGDGPPIAEVPPGPDPVPSYPLRVEPHGMTREHRSWRTKVFVATWLSYVGFYFARKPFSAAKAAIGHEMNWSATTLANIWAAYLIAYSLGQFIASYMGTKLGPRVNVLLGMCASLTVGVICGVAHDPWVMGGLVAVNGLAQATGWSGNVASMAGWFTKNERGRVMGAWSTNFTVGSLVSTWVMAAVLNAHDPKEPEPWRWCFFVGSIVLAAIAIQFFFFQRNKPEDVGLAALDDPTTEKDESKVPEQPVSTGLGGLNGTQWTNLLLVAGFYFCAKFVRYAIWSWAPYFLQMNYKISGSGANLRSTLFELCGLPGVYFTGYLSDVFFKSRRSEVALIMMAGMTIATAALVLLGSTVGAGTFTVMLGAVGFTLYGPDALLSGAGAMDIGGRERAAFATAFISGIGSTGAVVQEVVIGRLYDSKGGNLTPVFVMLLGSALLGTLFCIALVMRNRRGGKGI
ncbi:MAG TPA: MFS transporter [Kofleriaceae bacterium]|jgi:OPA family sugar phosphate sensor protein UhpC-like MFS transporter